MGIIIRKITQRRITSNCYNLENDDIFLHELSRKSTCSINWQISIICIILTKMVACRFGRIRDLIGSIPV
jgi:hypothetical protein